VRARRLAVFDCDGTLSDGQAAVCEAMEHAFAHAGLPAPDRRAVRRIVGLSLPQAVAALVPDTPGEAHREVVEAYKQAFRRARLDGTLSEPLFEGVDEVLHSLSQQGWQLGVATGKSDRGLAATLTTHRIAGLFTTLQTADRHPSKPHPAMLLAAMDEALAEPGDTVMIGDTVYDMEMAQVAGARAIGVAWGYHEADELLAAGAEAVARSPAELRGLLA
jgi:phosphoglycolate phosphatase